MKSLLWLLILLMGTAGPGTVAAASGETLDAILDRVETRYAPAGFTARFFQTSTIKAMDITDTASGDIAVKRPGKMRWTYETPEPQTIVTDGQRLWIYRPQDNQVMVGTAPDFFSGGKGAGFLSNMRQLREDFDITLADPVDDGRFRLKLVPRLQGLGVSTIYVEVDKTSFDVESILTVNAYGDETRIELSAIAFQKTMADADFVFAIPEGAEILQLDQ